MQQSCTAFMQAEIAAWSVPSTWDIGMLCNSHTGLPSERPTQEWKLLCCIPACSCVQSPTPVAAAAAAHARHMCQPEPSASPSACHPRLSVSSHLRMARSLASPSPPLVTRSHTQLVQAAHLKDFAARCPHVAKLSSIGKSVEGLDLWVLQLGDRSLVDRPQPAFRYLANMHGDEPTGRCGTLDLHPLNYGCGQGLLQPSSREAAVYGVGGLSKHRTTPLPVSSAAPVPSTLAHSL